MQPCEPPGHPRCPALPLESATPPWEFVSVRNIFRAGWRGTTSFVARQTLNSARRAAVRGLWRQERERVRETGRGSREWTDAEKDELLRTGKVKGYQGHHIHSVNEHPELARDPNNIEFVRRDEHLERHGGDRRNPTPRQ
ncbi:MAG: hypothetical protein ACT4PJ_16750 [Gemmatimonadaceae bacterium]